MSSSARCWYCPIPALQKKGSKENSIQSLNLCNSRLSTNASKLLLQTLLPPKPRMAELYHLTALSFKQCYLSLDMVAKLAGALRLNRTLVKLDLSCNGLVSDRGVLLVRALVVWICTNNRTTSHSCIST